MARMWDIEPYKRSTMAGSLLTLAAALVFVLGACSSGDNDSVAEGSAVDDVATDCPTLGTESDPGFDPNYTQTITDAAECDGIEVGGDSDETFIDVNVGGSGTFTVTQADGDGCYQQGPDSYSSGVSKEYDFTGAASSDEQATVPFATDVDGGGDITLNTWEDPAGNGSERLACTWSYTFTPSE